MTAPGPGFALGPEVGVGVQRLVAVRDLTEPDGRRGLAPAYEQAGVVVAQVVEVAPIREPAAARCHVSTKRFRRMARPCSSVTTKPSGPGGRRPATRHGLDGHRRQRDRSTAGLGLRRSQRVPTTRAPEHRARCSTKREHSPRIDAVMIFVFEGNDIYTPLRQRLCRTDLTNDSGSRVFCYEEEAAYPVGTGLYRPQDDNFVSSQIRSHGRSFRLTDRSQPSSHIVGPSWIGQTGQPDAWTESQFPA